MERSGLTTLPTASCDDLAAVVKRPGPFVSVFLTTDPEVENAAMRSEQRWSALRPELEAAGAPTTALDAIEATVTDAHHEGNTLVAIATPDGIVHLEHEPDPPVADVGHVAPLPRLGAVIEWRQSSPPHLVVLADRVGADLLLFRRGRPDVMREAGGRDEVITKVNAGGWSQRRYQQRAENTWEMNANDVAAEISRLVDTSKARLVVVAGDERALQLIQAALPSEVLDRLHVIGGGRHVDGSLDAIADDVTTLVASAVAEDTVAVLAKFKEERGQHDRAADGPARTLEALAAAQVDVLLVHDDPEDERTAWFGPEPNHVATDRQTLVALGVTEPQQGRLVDIAIRAALGTSASVRIVPSAGGPTEGIGAVLRWA